MAGRRGRSSSSGSPPRDKCFGCRRSRPWGRRHSAGVAQCSGTAASLPRAARSRALRLASPATRIVRWWPIPVVALATSGNSLETLAPPVAALRHDRSTAGGLWYQGYNWAKGDGRGGVVLVGSHANSAFTFDDGVATGRGAGLSDLVVVRYDADGNRTWLRRSAPAVETRGPNLPR